MRLCGAVAYLLMIGGGEGAASIFPSKVLLQRKSCWPGVGGQRSYLRLSVCFSSVGKPKPVGFVFLLLLAQRLLLKPGVSERRVSFLKNTRWIAGLGEGVDGWEAASDGCFYFPPFSNWLSSVSYQSARRKHTLQSF